MDPEDLFNKPQTTGKIRVSHGGRKRRTKPYSRKNVRQPEEDDSNREKEKGCLEDIRSFKDNLPFYCMFGKGFLGKVASYVVPRWVSSWFSSTKQAIKEEDEPDESNEEVDDDDDDDDDDEKLKTSKVAEKNILTSNHVNQQPQHPSTRNMTSTPMVRNMPSFSIMSSEVIDPQEGPSGENPNVTNFVEKETAVKRSSFQLLSVDDKEDETGLSSAKQVKVEQGKSLLSPFQFSMGARPSGPPQKFLTLKNKPSFKVSSFISSSPIIPNSSSSSSFYPGRTSYGGAAAMQSRTLKRQRVSPVALNTLTRKGHIKPRSISSSQIGAVTSDTARKILGALEKMSSPIRDASKLPGSPSSVLFNQSKRISDPFLSSSASQLGISSNRPPSSALLAPRTVHIQHMERRNEPFRFGVGEIRQSAPVNTFKSQALPTSFSPEDDNKAGGKMKRQRTSSHYPAVNQMEEEPVNTLPEISNAAPLIMSSFPKFDFKSTTVRSSKSACVTSATQSKAPVIVKNRGIGDFQFSEPDKKSEEKRTTIGDTVKSGFQFSLPVVKEAEVNKKDSGAKNKSEEQVGFKIIDLTKSNESDSMKPRNEPSLSNNGNQSKMNNVWGKKPTGWECETCMIVNSNDCTVCVACNAVKPNQKGADTGKQSKISFGGKFKVSEGTWECSQCMVMNKQESKVCVACTAPKQAEKSEPEKSTRNSLALKFKADKDSWECDSCMLKNKAESQECVACNTKKPGNKAVKKNMPGFGNLLKAKFAVNADSWECSVCMVRNDSDKNECISCSSKKPGSECKTQLSSGSQPKPQSAGFGSLLKSKFASQEATWECATCMVQNKNDANECVSCTTPNPGSVPASKPAAFGTSSFSTTASTHTSAMKFGMSDGSSKGFVFGSSGSSGFKIGSTDGVAGSAFGSSDKTGFVFGKPTGSGGSVFGSNTKTTETSDEKRFVFGNKQVSGELNVGKSIGFSFSAPTAVKDGDSKDNENPSKTEENNNLSKITTDKSSFTTSDSSKDADLKSAFVKPELAKKTGEIKSIADAALAGLLKVPGSNISTPPITVPKMGKPEKEETLEGTPRFSVNAGWNGPTINDLNAPKTIMFDVKVPQNENIEPSKQSSSKTDSSPFMFGETEKKEPSFSLGRSSNSFNFASPSSNSGQKPTTANFNFGAGSTFAFKPTNAEEVPNPVVTTQANQKPVFDDSSKENKLKSSFQMPANFSFGPNSDQQSIPSLFGNNGNIAKNEANPIPSFQFNSEKTKSGTPFFEQATQSDSSGKKDNLFGNSITAPNLVFNSSESKAETNTNLVSSIKTPPIFQNTEKMSGTLFGGSSANAFNFGANSSTNSSSPFIFNQQPDQKTDNLVAGFGASKPNSTMFTDSVIKPAENKPFSFTNPSPGNQGAGPFKFGNAEFNSNTFRSSLPSSNASAGGFSFTSPPAGGAFSGNGITNSVPMFSPGTGSSAPTNRVMKRAVRRSKK